MNQPRIDIALFEPEIPGNAGSIGRTCVATASELYIVGPTPFEITDTRIKRAGLDYWPHLKWEFFENRELFFQAKEGRRLVLTSARIGERYDQFSYQDGDILVMGKETLGLADFLKSGWPVVHLPMWGPTRSINQANAATTLLYEAYRQVGFPEG